ncbi:hypothetical protein IQ247_26185 [Plectonema cf. radiosum LEGE 06105]|uniref:Uncharacterized protein n=1 Tax=Plectonema cf. radiosum LEGE 06105 TaxID=945769 RepID=A0A8J7FCS1_9CYAN|nr:hypothetical protein [Plectonema radiosum]MBE9216109.1 hypothetical protein [Plectonema cf. radiosum LEGE 06105]
MACGEPLSQRLSAVVSASRYQADDLVVKAGDSRENLINLMYLYYQS